MMVMIDDETVMMTMMGHGYDEDPYLFDDRDDDGYDEDPYLFHIRF